jgi:hypothetical protein
MASDDLRAVLSPLLSREQRIISITANSSIRLFDEEAFDSYISFLIIQAAMTRLLRMDLVQFG